MVCSRVVHAMEALVVLGVSYGTVLLQLIFLVWYDHNANTVVATALASLDVSGTQTHVLIAPSHIRFIFAIVSCSEPQPPRRRSRMHIRIQNVKVLKQAHGRAWLVEG